MKHLVFALFVCVIFCYSSAFAQHSLEVDDGHGHFSTIVATNPPGTYLLPPGGGQILSFTPGNSPSWLCGGNSNPISSIIGTLSLTDLLVQTHKITRLTFSNTPSATVPMVAFANTTSGIQGVRINGSLDATDTSTLTGSPGVWDLVVDGDQVVTGVFKVGGSLWFDGNSSTHTIGANHPLNIRTTSNDSLMFGTSNTTRMTITKNGFVGIGTKNPVSALHIVGNPAEPTNNNTAGFLVPDPFNHVLTVENMASNSKGNGIAVIIHNHSGDISTHDNPLADGSYTNNNTNYVTFYNDSGNHNHIVGRIEGFSYENYETLLDSTLAIILTKSIYNPFNYFTCNLGFDPNFVSFDPNFISITPPTLPTLTGGSWPSVSFSGISGGSLPSFTGGSVGSISVNNPFSPWPPNSPITGLSDPFSLDTDFINQLTARLLPLPYKGKIIQIVTDPLGAALTFASSFIAGVTYESGAGDYAEWLERADHNEKIYCGDVIGVTGGKISKTTTGASELMVASWKPCALGNMPEPGKEQFYNKSAFMGQVPVKMFGDVKKGDFIVPSGNNDGFAKAISPENIATSVFKNVLGIAWEDDPSPGVKFVKVAVGLKPDEMVKVIQDHAKQIKDLQEKVLQLNRLKMEIADLKASLESARQATFSKKKSKHSTQLSSK